MSKSDPEIIISCDGKDCDMTLEVQLTALAGGAYDERNVPSAMRAEGWISVAGRDYCDQCAWKVQEELRTA